MFKILENKFVFRTFLNFPMLSDRERQTVPESWTGHRKTLWARTNRSCPGNNEVVHFLGLRTQGRNHMMQYLDEVRRRLVSSALVDKHADLLYQIRCLTGSQCSLSRISEEIESNFRLRSTRRAAKRNTDWRKSNCLSAMPYNKQLQ